MSPSFHFRTLATWAPPQDDWPHSTNDLSARVSYLCVGFWNRVSLAFSQSPTFLSQNTWCLSPGALLPPLALLVVCTKPLWLHGACPFSLSPPCGSPGSHCLNVRGSMLRDNTDQDKLGSDWCLQGHFGDRSSQAGQGQGRGHWSP